LAKGDRAELAVEMLTEMGVDEIVPWQASRSIVRWSPDRAMRSLEKWRSTAREAAKQSRRLTVPKVSDRVSTAQLAQRVAIVDLALLLHEEAKESLAEVDLPSAGTILIIIGPEGGIAAEELRQLTQAGARSVSISEAVLRTSTAGVVALAGLKLRRESDAP
jgi:16S rRNA (uracil1498-N3)-methyltransferase